MNKKLLAGFAFAVVITAIWFLWPSKLPERPAADQRPTSPDAGMVLKAERAREDGRSLMAAQQPSGPDGGVDPGKRPAIKEEPPPPPKNDAENPLIGLEVGEANPAELREWKVPVGQTGVVVKAVDPGSPAAEALLEKGDVIVRAQRDKISTWESLQKAVGNRDHTVLTVYRAGYAFQVVLHRPFQADQ